MPTTPRLKLQAVVDVILQTGTIDSNLLRNNVADSLKSLKLPQIDLKNLFTMGDRQAQQAVLRQLDDYGKLVDEQLNKIEGKLDRSAKARAKALGVPAMPGDQRHEVLAEYKKQLAGSRDVAKALKQRVQGLLDLKVLPTTGKDFGEMLKIAEDASRGAVDLRKVLPADLAGAREAVTLLDTYRQETDRMIGALGKPGLYKEKVTLTPGGQPEELSFPVPAAALPGLKAQNAELADYVKQLKAGLDPKNVEKFAGSFDDLNKQVKGLGNQLTGTGNVLKKLKGTQLFDGYSERIGKLRNDLKQLRADVKEAGKIEDPVHSAAERQRLFREQASKEKELGKLRREIDRDVVNQRQTEFGRYVKDMARVERSGIAQAEAAVGRTLLKGVKTTEGVEAAIGKGEGAAVRGVQSVEYLKKKVAGSAGALLEYVRNADQATLATNKTFLTLESNLVRNQQLLATAQQKTRELMEATTPKGQRAAKTAEVKGEVGVKTQTAGVEKLRQILSGISDQLADPRLRGQAFDEMRRRLSGIESVANNASVALAKIGTGAGTEEGLRSLERIKGDLRKATTDATTLGKRLAEPRKQALARYEAGPELAAAAAGKEVVGRYGSTAELVSNVKSVDEMSQAVSYLRQRYGEAQEALKQYVDTSTEATRQTDDFKAKQAELQKQVRLTKTAYEDTQNVLNRMEKAETISGRQALSDKQFGAAALSEKSLLKIDSMKMGLGGLREELGKVRGQMPRKEFEEFAAKIDVADSKLTDLRNGFKEGLQIKDVDEQVRQLGRMSKSLTNVQGEFSNLKKGLQASTKLSTAEFKESIKRTQISEGERVLSSYGGSVEKFVTSSSSIVKMERALDALTARRDKVVSDLATERSKSEQERSQSTIDRLERDRVRQEQEISSVQRRRNELLKQGTVQAKETDLSKAGTKITDVRKSATQTTNALTRLSATVREFSRTSGSVEEVNASFKLLQNTVAQLKSRYDEIAGRKVTTADEARTQLRDLEAVQKQLRDTQSQIDKYRSVVRQASEEHVRGLEAERNALSRVQAEREKAIVDEATAGKAYRGERLITAAKGAAPAGVHPAITAAQQATLQDYEYLTAAYDKRTRALDDQIARTEELHRTRKQVSKEELDSLDTLKRERAQYDEARRVADERTREVRERVAKEEAALQEMSSAQKKSFRQAYGIDYDEITAITRGLTQTETALHRQINEVGTSLGKLKSAMKDGGTAKEREEVARLEAEYNRLTEAVKKTTATKRAMTKSFASVEAGMSAEAQLAARYAAGQRIVAEARGPGGTKEAEAIARGISAIPKEYRTQLDAVRDFLRVDLAAAQNEVNKLAARGTKETDKAFKEAAKKADTLKSAIRRVNRELTGHLNLTGQLGGLFRQFARYGLGYAAMYRALFAMRQLIGSVTELDAALISIKAVTQATDKEMLTISNSIKRVAITTKFTTNEIAQAAQVLAQAGVAVQDFPQALSSVALFASATESSIQTSADLISTMRNVFKELSDLDIANQLTQAVNISKLTADDLKTILSLSAQVSRSYQLTSEQYLAAVSTMRNAGIKASTVATGLRQALIEIFAPDSKSLKVLAKRYAEIGEERGPDEIRRQFFSYSTTGDPTLAVMTELKRLGFTGAGKGTFAGRTFDVRAENAVNALINNLDEYVASQTKLIFGNAAIRGAVTQMESLSNSMKNLGAAITVASHDMTMELLPSVEKLVDALTDAVVAISDFDLWLRSTSGSSVANTLLGGGLGAYAAFRALPGDARLARKIAQPFGGFAVGLGAAAGAQAGLTKLGVDEDVTDLVSQIAGGAASAAVFKLFDKGSLTANRGVMAIQRWSGNLLGWGQRLLKSLGPLNKLPGMLGSAATKLLGIPGLLLGAVQVYQYFFRDEAKEAKERLKAASREKEKADTKLEDARKKAEALRPSNQEEGYTAPENVLAGKSEQLGSQLVLVRKQINELFTRSRELTTEQLESANSILLELNRAGVEANTGARRALLNRLSEVTGLKIDEGSNLEREVTALQQEYGRITAEATGIFQEMQHNATTMYATARDSDLAEAPKTVEEAVARSFETAVRQTGMWDEVADRAEASTEDMLKLLDAWAKAFENLRPLIKELTSRTEEQVQSLNDQLNALSDTLSAARSPAEARTIARGVFQVPVTEEQYREQEAAAQRLRYLQYNRDTRTDLERAGDFFLGPFGYRSRQRSEVLEERGNVGAGVEVLEQNLASARKRTSESVEKVAMDLKGSLDNFVYIVKRAEDMPDLRAALKPMLESPEGLAITTSLAQAEGDTAAAARGMVIPPSPGMAVDVATVNKAITAFLGLLNQVASVYTGRPEQPEPPLTFEESDRYMQGEMALARLDIEIERLEDVKKYRNLDELIAAKKAIQLDLLTAEEEYYRAQLAEAGTRRERKSAQKKLNGLQLERIKLERDTTIAINKARQDAINEERSTLEEHLDSLRTRSEQMLAAPFFTNWEEYDRLDDDYKATLEKLIALINEQVETEGLKEEEAKNIIDRMRSAGTSIYQFAKAFDEAREATEQYLNSLSVLLDPNAIALPSQIPTAIHRRDRGINEPPAVRLESYEIQLQAQQEALRTYTESFSEAIDRVNSMRLEFAASGDKAIGTQLQQATVAASTLQEGIQGTINKIAELQEAVRGASLDIRGELAEAFDMEGIMSDMRAVVEENVRTLGEDIRGIFAQAFQDLSTTMVDSILGNLDEGPREALKQWAEDFVKGLTGRVMEAYFQKGLLSSFELLFPNAANPESNTNSVIAQALGFGSKAINAGVVNVSGKVVNLNGAGGTGGGLLSNLLGTGEAGVGAGGAPALEAVIAADPIGFDLDYGTEGLGAAAETAAASANAAVGAATQVSNATADAVNAAAGVASESTGFLDGILGIFPKIGSFFTDLFGKIGTGLTSVFENAVSLLSSVLGSAGTGGAGGSGLLGLFSIFFKEGGVVGRGPAKGYSKGGFIKGPGTATSDSIPGVVVGKTGRPEGNIWVSNGEAILNKRAVDALGVPFVDWINSSALRFKEGGVIGEDGEYDVRGARVVSRDWDAPAEMAALPGPVVYNSSDGGDRPPGPVVRNVQETPEEKAKRRAKEKALVEERKSKEDKFAVGGVVGPAAPTTSAVPAGPASPSQAAITSPAAILGAAAARSAPAPAPGTATGGAPSAAPIQSFATGGVVEGDFNSVTIKKQESRGYDPSLTIPALSFSWSLGEDGTASGIDYPPGGEAPMVAEKFSDGGFISGPGTSTSDSIPGIVVDSTGRPHAGIKVSNGEAILNKKAVDALGKPFISWVNSNAARFASGGVVGDKLIAAGQTVNMSNRMAVVNSPAQQDVGELADALLSGMRGSEPRTMALQVQESSLHRTLRDYLEDYFADVVAVR